MTIAPWPDRRGPSPTILPPLNSTNRSQMRARVTELMDRQEERSPTSRVRAKDLHDVPRLTQIETVERLVEH